MQDTVQFGDDWLDSPLTHDSALTDANALLSTRIGSPTTDQLSQPVCVLVHGFSASSFEFEAFVDTVSTQRPDVLFSQVVMGGHGRDYEAFKQATYQDWLQPVIDEINQLQNIGYSDISIVGVSAGAAGIVHLLLNRQISGCVS